MGWTLAEMSRRTGLAPSTLSRIERGLIARPERESLEAIAAAYGEPVATIFPGEIAWMFQPPHREEASA